jgi:hypothetical protein
VKYYALISLRFVPYFTESCTVGLSEDWGLKGVYDLLSRERRNRCRA